MEQTPIQNRLPTFTILTILLFVAGRIFGDTLFDNAWSFTHWNHLSAWYLAGWSVAAIILLVVLGRFLPPIGALFESRTYSAAAAAVVVVLFIVFQFDSFLYGRGNILLARVAQADDVVFRWFEYGYAALAWLLYRGYEAVGLATNTAGVYGFKTLTFIAATMCLIGAIVLGRLLSVDPTRRLGLILILLFGPQFLVYFGFVGVAPIIAAVVIWFAVTAVRLTRTYSFQNLLFVWLLLAAGVILHISSLFLLPAALFVTIAAARRRKTTIPFAGHVIGIAVLAALVVAVYLRAEDNLLLKTSVLFPDGKNPRSDYGLFAGRHLGDVVQTLFLLFPLIIPTLYLATGRFREVLVNARMGTAAYMTLSGLALVLIFDPVNSIVLDLPRLAGYLAPGAVLLAMLINERPRDRSLNPGAVGVTAAAALLLPLSVLPVYTNIDTAEDHVSEYLDRHESYYRTAIIAFRDAYFYRGELDDANRWEADLDLKSPDYLNYVGILEFIQGERLDIALPSLNKLIVRNPYWAELRALLGTLMRQRGQFSLARSQLDTALMLEPYNPTHHINWYGLFRDAGQMPRALEEVREASKLFPHNQTIQTDRMLINFRLGNREIARELADSLLAADSTNAYPYAVKGFIAEAAGNRRAAIDYYERFADLEPDAPETPGIRKRANNLFMELREEGTVP